MNIALDSGAIIVQCYPIMTCNQILMGQKMVAQLTGFLCSLIHLNCSTAGFFPKSLFKGVKRYSVAAELIDCSPVLDCANQIKFCSLSSIVLNNNFIIVAISFWFVEV